MSSIRNAYNNWSETYDTVENKTRDLDAKALKAATDSIEFRDALEIGCGTGKNTECLAGIAKRLTAVDFSEGMLEKARNKVHAPNVSFQQMDITTGWQLTANSFDFACCNLILEHVKDLHFVFTEAARVLRPGGHFFISELHPFKQYTGSKARFEKEGELIILDTYLHHTSEYLSAAKAANLSLVDLTEWFDDDNKDLPRILALLFRKQ